MNKRKFIIILLFVIITGITGFFLFQPKTQLASPPDINNNAGSAPRDIPSLPGSGLSNKNSTVTFTFQATNEKLPESLPSYGVTRPAVPGDPRAIASALGFLGTPSVPSYEKSALFWSNDTGSLSIHSDSPSLVFTSSQNATKAAQSQEAISAARTFISKIGVSATGLSYGSGDVAFMTVEGSTYYPAANQENASVSVVSLPYGVENKPIYAQDGLPLINTFQVHEGGVVSSARVVFPPTITGSRARATVPIDLARQGLASGRGLLVDIVKNASEETFSTDVAFSNVTIQTQDLIYIYNRNTSMLMPVYLFKGVVTRGDNELMGATVSYFVSAVYY